MQEMAVFGSNFGANQQLRGLKGNNQRSKADIPINGDWVPDIGGASCRGIPGLRMSDIPIKGHLWESQFAIGV